MTYRYMVSSKHVIRFVRTPNQLCAYLDRLDALSITYTVYAIEA